MIKNGENKVCLICSKNFYVSGYRKTKAICCSPECLFKYRAVNKDKCLNGLPILCNKHGLHSEWRYKKSNSNTVCRKCLREQMNKSYNDPTKKLNFLLSWARHRAKKFEREFDLDKEFLEQMLIKQNNKCALSGITFISNDPQFDMSIDRIDSKRGYSKDNVQLVTTIINTMKMQFSMEDFVDMCSCIVKFRKG